MNLKHSNSFKKLFVILSMLSLGGPLGAQTINLKETNSSFEHVLKSVRNQTRFDIIGDLSLIRNAKPVTVAFNGLSIENVLIKLSQGQNFELILKEKTIVVKGKSSATNHQIQSTNQRYELSGVITGAGNSKLGGVTIRISGQQRSFTTTNNGTFKFLVEGDELLVISMLGYKTLEIAVNNQKELNINLVPLDNQIEEVEVKTGYTSRKKESMTGASTVISRKEIEKFNTNNIFSIIQSVDPAFKVGENNLNGSNPNTLPEITIRGTNSVGEYAVNAPLVIIDGFESTIEKLYDLDINRIESISILKDASSTVLYGSRGGNGVVVIETRLPKDGKFTVTYEAKPSITAVDLSDYNLMNAEQKLAYEKLAGVYTSVSTDQSYRQRQQVNMDNIYNQRYLNILSGVDTYWLSQPVSTNLSVGHSIRLEGGSNQVRYSIDGSYVDFKGSMKDSGRQRTGAGFNLEYRIPQKITLRNIASFQSSKAYNSPYGNFSLYAKMNPYERIYDDNGELVVVYNDEFLAPATDKSVAYNPLYNAQLGHRDYTNNTIIANNLSFEWYINKHIIFNAKGVLEKTFVDGETFKSPKHTDFINTDVLQRGRYIISEGKYMSYYVNAQLTYARNVGKHAINWSAIAELSDKNDMLNTHSLTGFADDEKISPSYATYFDPEYSVLRNPSRLVGTVLTSNYTYDKRYVLDGSYRMDGSSKFGANNRYSNFWSVGLGWNMHNENFFKSDFVQMLRLFVNTGTNGADNFSANMTNTAYTLASNNNYYNLIGLEYVNEGNENLKWPQIQSLSAGMNAKIWDGIINFTGSIYKKTTDQMISLIQAAPSLGIIGNSYFANLGRTQNIGFESSINIKAFENQEKGFSWYLGASSVSNKSKLMEISEELKALNDRNLKQNEDNTYNQSVYYEQGESLNNIKGVPSLGIDPNTGREVYMDRDGNITYNWSASNVQIIGNTEPKLFGTLNSVINYRRLSLQAYFNYSLQGDVYNQTLVNKIENVNPQLNGDLRILEDRWKNVGDLVQFKAISDRSTTLLSSRFVQRENYIRFSSLNVNYDFEKSMLDKFNLQRLRLNFSMNDVFRISTVRMERGTEYPFARTFNFGLMLQY